MNFEKDHKIIRRDFPENNPLEFIRISNHFVDDFLYQDEKMIDIPINALRIIFNIISILRNDQFTPKNQPRQLSIFEEEFETENNVFVSMKIRNSKISKHRSSQQIIKAYEFLTDYKKGWYTSKNSAGKNIKTYGGLISMPSYQEKGYTSFLISSYWLKKLIFISEYNHIIYQLVYKIRNNKHVLFALWLEQIPEDGTKINRMTLNTRFGVNYKTSNDLCQKFLKPIRQSLNRQSLNENEFPKSFNYKYIGELIYIVPYLTKSIKKEILNKPTNDIRLVNRKLRYFSKRYCIESRCFAHFKYHYKEMPQSRKFIDDSYKQFITNNRSRKIKSTEITGVTFLKEIQKLVIEAYRETETGKRLPNAYPVII